MTSTTDTAADQLRRNVLAQLERRNAIETGRSEAEQLESEPEQQALSMSAESVDTCPICSAPLVANQAEGARLFRPHLFHCRTTAIVNGTYSSAVERCGCAHSPATGAKL